MTAETDIAAIDTGGANTALEVRTALTSVLNRTDLLLNPDALTGDILDTFDDASLDAAWGKVEASAQMVVSEQAGVLSLYLPGATGVSHAHALVRPITMTADQDLTIECAFRAMVGIQNYHLFGLIAADGNTYGAGKQTWGGMDLAASGQLNDIVRSYTNYNSQASASGNNACNSIGAWAYQRLSLVGSTGVWTVTLSPDGVNWIQAGTNTVTNDFTPTHVGLAISDWNASLAIAVSVGYFLAVVT